MRDCGLEVATKGALVCHRRTCGAGRRLEDGRRECGDAVPASPTRTSPVTCGLAGLGGGEMRRWVTGEGGLLLGGGGERTFGWGGGEVVGLLGAKRGWSGEGGRRRGCEQEG